MKKEENYIGKKESVEELEKILKGRVKELEESYKVSTPEDYKKGLMADIKLLESTIKSAKYDAELERFRQRLATESIEIPGEEKKKYTACPEGAGEEDADAEYLAGEQKAIHQGLERLSKELGRNGYVLREDLNALERRLRDAEDLGLSGKDFEEKIDGMKRYAERKKYS